MNQRLALLLRRPSDIDVDPQRFWLFVVLDLGAAIGGTITIAVVMAWLDGGWLWPLFAATLVSVGLLAAALRLYAGRRVDMAVLAVCTTFWLMLVVAPLTVPSLFPGFAVLMVWPVLFALPHVSRPIVLRIVVVTGVCAVIALLLATRPASAEVRALPDVLLDVMLVAIGITFVTLSLTALYGYSGRLSEIVEGLRRANEALQASERDLEAKVFERTAALAHANADLLSSREETARARDEAVGLSRELVAVLNHLADGLLVLDPGGRVIRLNPALERMVGRSADELLDRPVRELFGDLPDLAPRGRAAVAEIALAGGRVGKAVASTVLDSDGATTRGTVVLISDVTAEREVDRMKTDFISTVSHELRTPLTSILGFAKIIARRLDERVLPAVSEPDVRTTRAIQQVMRNLDIIVTEGQRLTALINDVLDIAKMEAGEVEWRDEEVVLDDVVRRSAAATAALFDAKSLPLLTESGPEPLIVRGPHRLEQVVINLLSNACKFTDAGWVTVRIEQRGADAVLSVIDTGVGAAAEDLPKLFARFKQVGDTLTGKPQGTGLGLPICKEIIEHHGGAIWADSTLGVGSTFSFRLPLARTVPTQRKPLDTGVLLKDLRGGLPAPRTEGRARILVVDDSAALRELLRTEFEAEGYEVHEAADGRAALQLAKELRPDLITLDVLMPELNGFDVAAVLRHEPATMHIPIVIVSVIDEAERGRQIGVDRYFTKPIDSVELLNQVSALLAQGRSGRRVVVVDRDERLVDTLRSTLEQQGWEVDVVPDAGAAVAAVRAHVPDVVLANAELSDRLVEVIRAERGMERVVFILFESVL
jgi:PAS domain S-box-containing protein